MAEKTDEPRSGKGIFGRWRRKTSEPGDGDTPAAEISEKCEEKTRETGFAASSEENPVDSAAETAGQAEYPGSLEPEPEARQQQWSGREVEGEATVAKTQASTAAEKPLPQKPAGLFGRALAKTGRGLETLFLGRRQIDEHTLEDLETQLLMADVGIEVCTEIIEVLTDRVRRRELSDSGALRKALHQIMLEMLAPCQQPLEPVGRHPFVILVVGVNGVGKTTTIGKLARKFQQHGQSVMLAAGDTFRAAAVEQLQAWGERNQVPVVAQHSGADSASVIYDAIQSATARGIDVLIADTAGRLHTKSNLMEELAKIKRVMAKLDEQAPHEVLLVLDAGTGQNAVRQVEEFNSAVAVSGLAVTKLDGTARGGVVLALCKRYGIPVRYLGLGEGMDDLQDFRAADYVRGLLSENSNTP